MGSKSHNYDDEISNGMSNNRGNDTSLIVNVNDTQSDIDEHEETHYSETENHQSAKKESSSKKSRNGNSSKRSSHKESKSRSKAIDLSKTRYLWVSGIPDGTKTNQLEALFLQYGKVLAIKIIRGGTDSTLLGFVKLETVEQAQKCMEKLNRVEFRGNKIELLKERPVDKDGKKPEKIGFRDARKPFIPRPIPSRPHLRPPHSAPRGTFRPPIKSLMPAPHRQHQRISSDLRRQEREEYLKLEREKERLKLERMKLERDRAELLKIERESRGYEREPRVHEEKRVRSMVKRPVEEPFLEEIQMKYNRREIAEYPRRYEARSSPSDRKGNSGRPFSSSTRGRFEDPRHERFPDKFASRDKFHSSSDNWSSGDNHRWQSSSNFESSSRMLSSSIGSSSISRLHSSVDIPQNVSSRSYFSSSRRY